MRVIGFLILKHLSMWNKSHLVIKCNSFNTSSQSIFVEDFYIYIHEKYWSVVSFSGLGMTELAL